MVTKSYVLARIEEMQRELDELRKSVADTKDRAKARASLYGALEGVEFTEKEIKDAKRSLLRDADSLGVDQ